MEDALNKLALYFPSVDRNFLEDVYVSTKKDFDKTVDEFLAMGMELTVDKKDKKPAPVISPSPIINNNKVINNSLPPPITPTIPSSHPSSLPPTNPHYYTPGSPLPLHHQPPINPTLSSSHSSSLSPIPTTSSPPSLHSSSSYPRGGMDMYSIPATPPPINNNISSSSSSLSSSTAPTAPLQVKNDSQVEQKRESLKQELSLEYQRISETHKFNLELQQKLEQLREFTTSEQRKLEEQRTTFNEEKRRFAEDLTNKYKALQDENARQKAELFAQEEQRLAEAQAQAEIKLEEKRNRRRIKDEQRAAEFAIRQREEEERRAEVEEMKRKVEKLTALTVELQQCNDDLAEFKYQAEDQIQQLQTDNKNLKRKLKKTESESSAEVLSYFSSLVSSLADGIHAVSLQRVNNESNQSNDDGEAGEEREEGEEGEKVSPLADLKRTFFTTIQESLNNKIRESSQ